MTRLVLDQSLDPFSARVLVERDPDGLIFDAWLDLDGLPRVDSILVGRAVATVPPLVERLCGVCPVAHHLAGVQALESLAGVTAIPQAAGRIRRLLHYGSVLSMHADRFRIAGYEGASVLRQLAKLAQAAAGSPGHYPVTAIVGGVSGPVQLQAFEECRRVWPAALQAALALVGHDQVSGPDSFTGPDVALVDAEGHPDLLGPYLRAVSRDGTAVIERAEALQWPDLVAEGDPGAGTPRPYLIKLGPTAGLYRVGPLAQVRVGTLTTPLAAELQQGWWESQAGAYLARAVMAVHCVETIGLILDQPDRLNGSTGVPVTPVAAVGQAVGWVDGARGLLVHHYRSAADGSVSAAQVLTPTAQNEFWLSRLLLQAAQTAQAVSDGPVTVSAEIENAIREADPCLPCSLAPPGRMGLVVQQSRKTHWQEGG